MSLAPSARLCKLDPNRMMEQGPVSAADRSEDGSLTSPYWLVTQAFTPLTSRHGYRFLSHSHSRLCPHPHATNRVSPFSFGAHVTCTVVWVGIAVSRSEAQPSQRSAQSNTPPIASKCVLRDLAILLSIISVCYHPNDDSHCAFMNIFPLFLFKEVIVKILTVWGKLKFTCVCLCIQQSIRSASLTHLCFFCH